MSAIDSSPSVMSDPWQAGFLAVLPAVHTHAQICFRKLPAEQRQEAIQEAVAFACLSYQDLAQRGKLHAAHPGTLADYAVKRVRNDRHVGGRQSSRDVHSRLAQKKRGLVLQSLTPWQPGRPGWRAVVLEDKRVLPSDQAAFNLDFVQWLGGFDERQQGIIGQLAAGEGTGQVARRFGLSAARVSQLRRQFEQSWLQFQGMN